MSIINDVNLTTLKFGASVKSFDGRTFGEVIQNDIYTDEITHSPC